jgi:hypothetical protein
MKRSQVTIAIVAVFAVALVYVVTSGGGGGDDAGGKGGGASGAKAPAGTEMERIAVERRRPTCATCASR